VEKRTPAGIYLGSQPGYRVDNSRLSRVASRIVRGLFFHETGSPLPQYYQAASWFRDGLLKPNRPSASQVAVEAFDREANWLRNRRPSVVLGDGVFRYWWVAVEADPVITRWLFVFYNAVAVFGFTAPHTKMAGTQAIGFPRPPTT
jgi:hypothetical protein